jgi:hypothetical protein
MSRVAALMLIAVPWVGCDTTDPAQVEMQTVELTMLATGAPKFSGSTGIKSFDTWIMFEDGDLDPATDDPVDFDGDGDGDSFLWCQNVSGFPPTHNAPSSVPWSYTIRVSIIRAGETEPEVLTSQQALQEDPARNLTLYDGSVTNSLTSHKQPICLDASNAVVPNCSGNVARMFRFINNSSLRRKMSQANRTVATATFNPLSDANPTFALGFGLCSEEDPGPPVIDGQDPWILEINKGDTLVVEARRGMTAPSGLPFSGTLDDKVSLEGRLTVDGRVVTVNGVTGSPSQGGAPIKFTYTSR